VTDPADPSILRAENIHAAAQQGGVAVGAVQVTGDVDKLQIGNTYVNEALTLRATPPAPPPHFTGREDDLAKFTQLLTSGQNVAITALQGLGGIGKTALAQKLAERVRDQFPGGVLWWTLGPSADVFTALDVWARHANPNADLRDYPRAEDRAEAVRPLLARLGKLCVIIDDIWDEAAARTLMSAIPPGGPILITTRDGDLAKSLRCRVERIDALTDDEAVALLVNLLGPLNGREDAACDIAHLTEGLPLALELIAGIADSPTDLPDLARELHTKPTLDVLKRGTTREQSIEACFTMSYERLNADMQRRFRALGVFAPAPFDRDAIAAVWDEEGDGVDEAIKFLMRRSLLTRVTGDTFEEYHQHALLRDYAMKLLKEHAPHPSHLPPSGGPPPMKDASTGEGAASPPSPVADGGRAGDGGFASRHATYYRRFAEEKDWRNVEHFFDQIDHGWQWVQANAPDQITEYAQSVWKFLDTRGRKVEVLNWFQVGLTQARTVKDRENEGWFLSAVGYVYDDFGQKDKALDFYQQALAIRREVGDRSGEGATLNNIGSVYWSTGRNEEALKTYQEVLVIRHEVGDRSSEATTLNNIGTVHANLGQPDKALDFYQQALAIWREVGDRSGEGTTLNNIGLVYDDLGQMDKALDFYQQALPIHREVGNRYAEGVTLWNMGDLFERMDRFKEAEEVSQQAVVALRDCSSPQADQAQEWLDRVRGKLGKTGN
jgi:tetratricopeptide (TPR) repeat protein